MKKKKNNFWKGLALTAIIAAITALIYKKTRPKMIKK
jgi:hypothetical protein